MANGVGHCEKSESAGTICSEEVPHKKGFIMFTICHVGFRKRHDDITESQEKKMKKWRTDVSQELAFCIRALL
jgi:hypothetical protein